MRKSPISPRTLVKRAVIGAWTHFSGDEHGRLGVKTLSGPARGLRFRLDLVGNFEMRYFIGNYEREIVDRLLGFVQPGWVVWDVGIYIGYYTCLFARLVGSDGQVVAIEADPRNLARTRENVAMNNFTNVIFINAAIGTPDAEVDLFLDEGTNSHLAEAWIGGNPEDYAAAASHSRCVKVKCQSLDQLLAGGLAPKPNLIKLDIDGAEIWAMQHLDTLAKTVRPLLLVELHNPQCDLAAWRFACEWGYDIERFDTGEIYTKAESVCGTVLLRPH